jgi:hypothetical protein
MSVACDKTFPLVPNVSDLLTLTMMFDLLIKKINLGYIFSLVDTWALTFHMTIPCDKTFTWLPQKLTL